MRETWLFHFNNMKIMILSYAAGLTEILSGKLKEFGLAAERIDYNKPVLTQITDADVLVNGLGKVNNLSNNRSKENGERKRRFV
jgi:hypothetical protein